MTDINFYQEMEYGVEYPRPVVLADGYYKNTYFLVVSFGSHPCAYVKVPYQFSLTNIKKGDYSPHGGYTFCDNLYSTYFNRHIDEGNFIGWDYAHAGDELNFIQSHRIIGCKHTTKEIVVEAKKVIDSLLRRFNELNNSATQTQKTPTKNS